MRDARDHPALDEGESGDVGRDREGGGDQPADVGEKALRSGVAHVVLDQLVDGPVDIAVLLGQLLLRRVRGWCQRPDTVDRAVEGLPHELRGQPGRELGDLRGQLQADALGDAHAARVVTTA